MGNLGSTSGLKSSQAEWFAADILAPNNYTGVLQLHIAITAALGVSYTVDSGTTWIKLNKGDTLVADAGYFFEVPADSATLFNLRRADAGDVTVTLCRVGFQ